MAVFTSVAANVVDPVQISDSITTYYTAPATAGGYAEIVEMSVANDTTTSVVISLYNVPSGGSADDTNIITKNLTLPAGSSISITKLLGHIYLEPSGFIRAIAAAASQATLKITAFEVS